MSDNGSVYPMGTPEIGRRRKDLAPEIHEAFENFSRTVFRAGALDASRALTAGTHGRRPLRVSPELGS